VLGLRSRIALAALASTATALVAMMLMVGPALRERAIEENRETLVVKAALMAHVVQRALEGGEGGGELDRIVDEAARESGGSRFTLVAPDGRVLADSAVSGAALAGVENHLGRPEIQQALGAGRGTSTRRSSTVGDDLVYAAVTIRARDGHVLGYSRVARPMRGVERDVAQLRRSVGLALLAAFAITAILSVAVASSVAGPLRAVMDSARRFAAGDLSARSAVGRRDEIGELARILNHSADQLQARLTEIARERARTGAILSAMEDGLLAVDHEGAVLLANDILVKSLALRDFVGRHYLEVVRQRDVTALIEDVLRSGERREAEVAVAHARRVYALAGVPFPGLEGAPHGAVLTFHDVTERRRADQVRRDFVANASHELRTPLTSIRGFVEALEDGAIEEPPTAQRFLGKIRAHADRMAALVADLLELSRLEAGERPLDCAPVSPSEVAEEVALSLQPRALERAVAVTVSDEGAPPVVTDAEALRRILENLVENAIKYTKEGGQVQILVRPRAGGAVAVEVADDGPGIAAEHLPRIFERFYRVDKARSREIGGTGLGLAIVRHLAESLGARIAVESEPGHGTRFVLELPPAVKSV
jgi:two-component system phosphate regulon sensor histidine kinase PhoR